MGTTMHFGELLPAIDRAEKTNPGAKRWLEVVTSHGRISIHIGSELNEEHDHTGYWVELSASAAKSLITGLDRALSYEGHGSMLE